ncbi:unnamed protein product [Clonostachys rhizophaga]|uniref:Uncharacterized protein n=1 Tax=Clonostachys rhizophaga TaxID=160324 RepID=A0A9N9VZM3_9HYPO|nr:unnamed protein product [Clonostachys rhizophaga]
MDSSQAWSVFHRAQIDEIIQQGRQDTLCSTISSHLKTINIQYILNSRPEEFYVSELRDIWYTLIQAGKNITTDELLEDGISQGCRQDDIVRELVTFRALGTLQRSVQTSNLDDDSNKGTDSVQGVITFSDGHTLWSGLPLLSICLTEEFTKYYYQKDYSAEQQGNMAGLIARLLAAGFYDGPGLCALSLFRETLETSRPLVTDADSKETSETLLSLEDLLGHLTELCQNSGYGLAILSSSQTSAATMSMIKTNAADYPHLSNLGDLALQAGTTTDSSPTGYSPQRWGFWVQRLTELTQCGVKSIERTAKFCLGPMRWAGDETNLLPGLISEELVIFEDEYDELACI